MRAMLSMGMLLFSAVAAAQGVYKWVDGNGRVHYGERPPGGAQATPMELRQSLTPAPSATVEQDRLENQRRLLESFQEERARKQEHAAKAAKGAEERKRNCALARDRLRRVQEAGFLYNIDKNGERRILSDGERSASERNAQAAVSKWCRS